jgi:hypothetical protein
MIYERLVWEGVSFVATSINWKAARQKRPLPIGSTVVAMCWKRLFRCDYIAHSNLAVSYDRAIQPGTMSQ